MTIREVISTTNVQAIAAELLLVEPKMVQSLELHMLIADSTQLERSFQPDLSMCSGALERGRSEATSGWVQGY